MTEILSIVAPEIVLASMACVLFLVGCSTNTAARRCIPFLALAALVAAGLLQWRLPVETNPKSYLSLQIGDTARYLRFLALGIAIVLLFLAWPTNKDGSGNSAMNFGQDAGEFFALFLLSISGLLLVTVANDLIILFLALELVSIPTYIMVSISRPIAAAQEAGVKYFFLGALSVALMLFGFSYLYGATGRINLREIGTILQQTMNANGGKLPGWEKIGVLLIIIGLAFKMAAFPLHFYAGDVYEGAATPVTAFLAFVPKTAGFAALLNILYAVGGNSFSIPPQIATLLWVLAAFTMSVGNVLGLLQNNVKRVLAYSSIAHSGYMLVGAAAISFKPSPALEGILVYLAAYGIMNAAAFGVLMLIPGADPGTSAETFEDIAGVGRERVAVGLAMAVSCFSLIGLPLTVGFFGKLMLIRAALDADLFWLVIILILNAAVSAAYYLRIVATMFLRPASAKFESSEPLSATQQWAVVTAITLSTLGTLALGTLPNVTDIIVNAAHDAASDTVASNNQPSPKVGLAVDGERSSANISGLKAKPTNSGG